MTFIGVLEQLAGFYTGQRVVLIGVGCRRTGASRCAPSSTASTTGCR